MVIKFCENRVRRAYYGGKRIDKFLGKTNCEDTRYPEEWIASTVEAFNPDMPTECEGLSVCEDGSIFRDVLNANTEEILGKSLCEKYNGKMSILVKLLDSAERLVIQCHPTIPFAKKHFNSSFGKAECWYMLDTESDACIYLGFKPGTTKEQWKELFEKQDTNGMLNCLHKFPVKQGELWFVDGGVPHAIGAGCFMIELQEPSDLMVIPERYTPSGVKLVDSKLHGGLGFDKMFDCFEYISLSAEETKRKYCKNVGYSDNAMNDIVDAQLTDKFSLKNLRVNGTATVDFGERYAIAVVTNGSGTLTTGDNKTMKVEKGENFFISASSGTLSLQGCVDIVFCLP